jgi:putative restriction endonuclease
MPSKPQKNGKNWIHAAGILWPHLTAAAASRRKPTYNELARIIGTNPLSVRNALSPIQDFCLAERLPPLTAIVVGTYSRKPGKGFIAWDISDIGEAYQAVFAKNWKDTPNPFKDFGPDDTIDTLAARLLKAPDKSKTVYEKVKKRGVAQIVFRKALLKAYDQQCAICGLTFEQALQACHIVPWSNATAEQRLDPRNGVLLCATHHSLFDAALMTINGQFQLIYFDQRMKQGHYSASDKAISAEYHGKPIYLPKLKNLWPLISNLEIRHDLQAWKPEQLK